MKFRLPGLAAMLVAAPAAQAVEFTQYQHGKSSLAFVYKQMNVPVDGQFKSFRARLAFDPSKPTAARAEFEIDLASVDAGSKDANDEVAGKAWFDTPSFPRARFVSQGVKALGDSRYEVSGTLAIKGREQAVVVPATVSTQGDSAVFEGRFTIKRGDFAVGEGAWSAFDIVANEVHVTFRITADSGTNPQGE